MATYFVGKRAIPFTKPEGAPSPCSMFSLIERAVILDAFVEDSFAPFFGMHGVDDLSQLMFGTWQGIYQKRVITSSEIHGAIQQNKLEECFYKAAAVLAGRNHHYARQIMCTPKQHFRCFESLGDDTLRQKINLVAVDAIDEFTTNDFATDDRKEQLWLALDCLVAEAIAIGDPFNREALRKANNFYLEAHDVYEYKRPRPAGLRELCEAAQ